MNIHEHQAKEILKEYGAPISNGVVILSKEEIDDKISKLNKNEYVLKAQIHAGGRGKAGGVKLIKNKNELILEAKKNDGKNSCYSSNRIRRKRSKKALRRRGLKYF